MSGINGEEDEQPARRSAIKGISRSLVERRDSRQTYRGE